MCTEGCVCVCVLGTGWGVGGAEAYVAFTTFCFQTDYSRLLGKAALTRPPFSSSCTDSLLCFGCIISSFSPLWHSLPFAKLLAAVAFLETLTAFCCTHQSICVLSAQVFFLPRSHSPLYHCRTVSTTHDSGTVKVRPTLESYSH